MSKIINLDKISLTTFVIIFIFITFIFITFIAITFMYILKTFTTSKEPLDIMNGIISDIPDLNPASSFCKSFLGNSANLEPECNKLTQQKCNQTGCCVFSTNNESVNGKCVAGDITGPTYNADKILKDTYYFQGKCYGQCPT
jgi:hypothetical protein